MVDVFEEVNEELKDDEFNLWLRKFGPKIVVLSVLVILFTAGRVIHSNYKSSQNKKQTEVLSEIMDLSKEADSIATIEKKALDLGDNHELLSKLILASAHSEVGELKEANLIYDNLIADKSVSKEYKELATVYLVQNVLNMEDGDVSKAQSLIKPMLSKENSFYYIVSEQNALIELRLGNKESAKSIFENLSNDYEAPEEIRSRAEKIKTVIKVSD